MKTKKIISLLLLSVLLFSCHKKYKCHVYGHVTDETTGGPMKNFKIAVDSKFFYTDDNGDYSGFIEYTNNSSDPVHSSSEIFIEAIGNGKATSCGLGCTPNEYYHFYNNDNKSGVGRKISESIEVNFICACQTLMKPVFKNLGSGNTFQISYYVSNPIESLPAKNLCLYFQNCPGTWGDMFVDTYLLSNFKNEFHYSTEGSSGVIDYVATYTPACGHQEIRDTLYYYQ